MISYRDLVAGFKKLDLEPSKPIIVHASLSGFGEIRGGAETLLGALLANFDKIMAPTFTYKTMIIPEEGPEYNGIDYGSGKDLNRMAEFFTEDMPADKLMGQLAETIRRHPEAKRSFHPILSFAGIGVDDALESQTLEEPLAPIMCLTEKGGYVLFLGVDHSANTGLHVAEQHAGRPGFTRWALTPRGIVECQNFPGCSNGFSNAAAELSDLTRQAVLGEALIQALPLDPMIQKVAGIVREDPEALLCNQPDCPRCNAVRSRIKA